MIDVRPMDGLFVEGYGCCIEGYGNFIEGWSL